MTENFSPPAEFPRLFSAALSEEAVWRCSVKEVFLKISQNSQGNTCVRVSFLIELQASGLFKI